MDPQSISNDAKYDADVAECRDLAKSDTETGKSVARHGLIGGAIGTGIGALLGLIAGKGASKNMKAYFKTVLGAEDMTSLTKTFLSIPFLISCKSESLSRLKLKS